MQPRKVVRNQLERTWTAFHCPASPRVAQGKPRPRRFERRLRGVLRV